jgi:zinc transporter ZupT
MGLFFPLAVAFVAPLLASLVPKFIYRQGLSAKANHIMLGISAGLLFAIATLDLVPEAFSMTAQASFSAPPTHGTATTPLLLYLTRCSISIYRRPHSHARWHVRRSTRPRSERERP